MSTGSPSIVRRVIAAMSALAVIIGISATAVAMSPAASATGSITKIEVASTTEFLTWTPPVADSVQALKAFPGDTSVRVTATFTGAASVTVGDGEPVTLTSTVPVSVPIAAGANRVTVIHEGSNYPIDVVKNPGIDGFEVYNGADDSLIQAFTGNSFDPGVRNYNVKLAPGVTSIRFKAFHFGIQDNHTYLRWSPGPTCDDACAFSGGFTGVQNVPQGMTTYTLRYTRFDREIPIDVTIIRDDVPEGFITVTAPESAAGTINQTGSIPAAGGIAAGTYLPTGQIVLSGGSNGWRTFRIVHQNASGGVIVDEQYTFVETVAAITAAADGGFWVSGDSGSVQKFELTDTGHYRPLPVFYGQGQGYIGNGRVIEDADGYLYSSSPFNVMNIFAPGAVNGDNPIRSFAQAAGGFAFDADGNILVGSFEGVEVYEPGSAGRNVPIRRFGSGTISGIGVDGAGRIYVNSNNTVKVYAPLSRGVGDPQLVFTKDISGWQSDVTNVIVDPVNAGKFAIVTGQFIQFFDISSALPALPTQGTPTVASVDFSGTAEVSQELTASATGVAGYPTPSLSYQWQTSPNGTDGWSDVAGATGARLVIPNSFVDQHIRVKAIVTSEAGSAEAVSSTTVGPIVAGPVRTQIGFMSGGDTRVARPFYMAKLSGDRFIVGNRFTTSDAEAGWYVYSNTANFNTKPLQRLYIPGVSMHPGGAAELPSGNFLLYNGAGGMRGKIYEVDKDANGAAVPVRVLNVGCDYGDVTVGVNGDIYAGCYNEGKVKVFAADASGDATPIRTIETGSSPVDLGWTPGGELYVTAGGGWIRYYPADADDNADKTKEVNLGWENWGVDFDSAGRVYVSSYAGLRIFPANFSSDTPIRWVRTMTDNDRYALLSGAGSGPTGLVYLAATDDVVVGSPDNSSLVRLDAAAIRIGDPTPPAQVEQPQVEVSSRRMVVTWNALPSDVTGYTVTVTGGAGPFTCTTTTETTCTFSFAGTPSFNIVNGVEYGVTVTAVNGRLTGTASAETRVTVAPNESIDPPDAPGNVTATGLAGTITVNWEAPAGSTSVYRARAVNGTTTLRCGMPTMVAETTCTITGAEVGKTYNVQVYATRTAEPKLSSAWSTAVPVLVKSRPSIGAVTITGTPRATYSLSATVPRSGGTPAPTLTYTWQTSGSSSTGFKDVTDPSETLSAYDLTIGNIGDYVRLKVSADNGTGDPVVRYSNVIGEILTKDGETKASLYVVKGVKATATGVTINVSWAKPVLGQPAAYTVTLKPKSGTTVTKTFTVVDETLDRMSLDATGLAAGTSYSVTVQVQGKTATTSTAASATTAVAPAAVKSLKATVKLSAVTVTWSAPSTGFTGTYTVTLTSASRTYTATVSGTSRVFQPVAKGTYTVKVVATSDVGVTGAAATVKVSVA